MDPLGTVVHPLSGVQPTSMRRKALRNGCVWQPVSTPLGTIPCLPPARATPRALTWQGADTSHERGHMSNQTRETIADIAGAVIITAFLFNLLSL